MPEQTDGNEERRINSRLIYVIVELRDVFGMDSIPSFITQKLSNRWCSDCSPFERNWTAWIFPKEACPNNDPKVRWTVQSENKHLILKYCTCKHKVPRNILVQESKSKERFVSSFHDCWTRQFIRTSPRGYITPQKPSFLLSKSDWSLTRSSLS